MLRMATLASSAILDAGDHFLALLPAHRRYVEPDVPLSLLATCPSRSMQCLFGVFEGNLFKSRIRICCGSGAPIEAICLSGVVNHNI